GGRVEQVARLHAGLAVRLAAERQDRVRSAFDRAADPAREVYAQERECRGRDRIDQVLDEVVRVLGELVVVATEWHDLHFGPLPAQRGDAIRVESREVHLDVRGDFALAGVGYHHAHSDAMF